MKRNVPEFSEILNNYSQCYGKHFSLSMDSQVKNIFLFGLPVVVAGSYISLMTKNWMEKKREREKVSVRE